MKYILTEEHIPVPENVTVTASRKNVEVKGMFTFNRSLGTRGVLKRSFKYASLDIKVQNKEGKDKKKKSRVAVQMWQVTGPSNDSLTESKNAKSILLPPKSET